MTVAASEGFLIRNPSVQTHYVHDEAVLAGGAGNELLALNATARAVWECCDGTASIADISARLAEAYDAPIADIQAGVQAIVQDLLAQGLLHLQGVETQPSGGRPVTSFVSFLDHHVEIYIDSPRLAPSFDRCMEATYGSGSGISLGRIEAHDHGEGYRVRNDRGGEATFSRKGEALTWMKRYFVTRFMEARSDLLWMHAGAVARGDEALLCAGHRGCGKSTLMTALYREGWAYFSDDVIPYDPKTGCVLPFPLTPVYRRGGVELVTAEELSTLKKTHISLDQERIAAGPTPVRLLIFPAFEPDTTGSVAPCPPAATVVKLNRHCFNLKNYLGDSTRALRDLAEQAAAYDVVHNADLPALEQLRTLLPS